MGRKRIRRNTLLVDADIMLYKAAVSCEVATCWDEEYEKWTLSADLKEAKGKIQDHVAELTEALGGIKVILAFSGRRNFRHDINPQYKANRRNKRKPIIFHPLREWAMQTWPSEYWPNVEADDILGILSKSHSVPAPKIVVSDDHDLMSCPCDLFQPMHPERGVRHITYKSARRYHLYQTLTGDSGDGYSGLPGVGPKGAEKILQEGTWDEVVAAYEAKGLNEEEALLQARMAKILTPSLYNMKTEEVTLWHPKKHK